MRPRAWFARRPPTPATHCVLCILRCSQTELLSLILRRPRPRPRAARRQLQSTSDPLQRAAPSSTRSFAFFPLFYYSQISFALLLPVVSRLTLLMQSAPVVDAQGNSVVVCDNGTGFVKCGYAGSDPPRTRLPLARGAPDSALLDQCRQHWAQSRSATLRSRQLALLTIFRIVHLSSPRCSTSATP